MVVMMSNVFREDVITIDVTNLVSYKRDNNNISKYVHFGMKM